MAERPAATAVGAAPKAPVRRVHTLTCSQPSGGWS